MIKEEWLVNIVKCVGGGVVLFFSAIFSLLLNHDMTHLELFSRKILMIIGIYILITSALMWISSLKIIRRLEAFLRGAAVVWWIFIIFFLLEAISPVVPEYIRYIVAMNVLVLLCCVVGNFLYMKHIADGLNQGKWNEGFVLMEDLEHRPGNEEEFMEWIASYCRRNALDYEVIQYGMPAKIMMDGLMYQVQVSEYCSMANGIVFAMEFLRIRDEVL